MPTEKTNDFNPLIPIVISIFGVMGGMFGIAIGLFSNIIGASIVGIVGAGPLIYIAIKSKVFDD